MPAQVAQSTLQAHGEPAAQILGITWVLFIGGALVFVVVMALCAVAIAGPAPLRSWLSQRRFVVAAGIVFPVLALTALLVHTFGIAAQMVRSQAQPAATRIQVTGELWWWRVRYLDADGHVLLETANEIHVPVGEPVDLLLASADVVHSVWLPSLAGKLDMLPGHVNRLRLRADAAGVYRGQCAEFCGIQHTEMLAEIEVKPAEEFDSWLEEQAQEQEAGTSDLGEQTFAGACAKCHGPEGQGLIGPEFTSANTADAEAVAQVVRNGRGRMPPIGEEWEDFHMEALTDYLSDRFGEEEER